MRVEESHYDVALWRVWPSLFPEYTDTIMAADHFEAIEIVMHTHEVHFAAHVAVALCAIGGHASYTRAFLASDGVHLTSVPLAA